MHGLRSGNGSHGRVPQDNGSAGMGGQMRSVSLPGNGAAPHDVREFFKVKPRRTPGMEAIPRCSIEVSMGNRYLDGDYLFAIVEWVNRTFHECTINLGDTLYRHNIKHVVGEEAAHEAARQLGDAWILRNAPALGALRVPNRLHRWDEWLAHPEFPDMKRGVREYYESNAFLRAVMMRDVERFTQRNGRQPEPGAATRCIDYILEEVAADTLYYRENPRVFLYPADPPSTYTYFSCTEVPELLRGLDNALYVRLSFCKRRRNPDVREDPVSSSRA